MAIDGISNVVASMYNTKQTTKTNETSEEFGNQKSSVPVSTENSTMSLQDFYYLLAAQLKYQDADNPMDTAEMMGTMVQTQMIQAISQMTQTNVTTYAASMIGKEVTVAEMDKDGMYTGDKTGTVTGVLLGDNPLIFVDGKAYYLSQIVAVGDIPKDDEATKPDESQKPSEGEGSGGTGGETTGGEDDKNTTV